jgi:DNA polymerase theta
MCGRAGRKGKDDAGETYLICIKADLEAVCDLLDADMPAIESCLAPEKRGLKRYVLAPATPSSFTHTFQGPS